MQLVAIFICHLPAQDTLFLFHKCACEHESQHLGPVDSVAMANPPCSLSLMVSAAGQCGTPLSLCGRASAWMSPDCQWCFIALGFSAHFMGKQ